MRPAGKDRLVSLTNALACYDVRSGELRQAVTRCSSAQNGSLVFHSITAVGKDTWKGMREGVARFGGFLQREQSAHVPANPTGVRSSLTISVVHSSSSTVGINLDHCLMAEVGLFQAQCLALYRLLYHLGAKQSIAVVGADRKTFAVT